MTRTLAAFVVLVLLVPATAAGQEPAGNAPPGNSAIDEYMETIPTVTGARGTGGGAPPEGAGAPGPVLAPEQRAELASRGTDGETLAVLVDTTSPPSAKRHAGGEPTAGQGGAPDPVGRVLPDGGQGAQSPITATLAAAVGQGDGGGMGLLLPLILVASLAGVIAIGVARLRA